MVVDAQIDPAIVCAPVPAAVADDEERRRLAAAPIATRAVGRRETRHEAFRERQRSGLERVGEGVDDGGTREDVALGREPIAYSPAGPRKAIGSGMTGAASVGIHDPNLALIAQVVRFDQPRERGRRVETVVEQREAIGPVGRVRERLGRDRPDTGARPRDHRAHPQELRLHGDRQIAGVLVERDDRERHAGSPATWRFTREALDRR